MGEQLLCYRHRLLFSYDHNAAERKIKSLKKIFWAKVCW